MVDSNLSRREIAIEVIVDNNQSRFEHEKVIQIVITNNPSGLKNLKSQSK